MGRKSHYHIRSELIADRENQATYRRRVQKEAFGVYRPLTEASALALQSALGTAHEDITTYLNGVYRRSPPKIKMQEELGVTFVARTMVRKSLKLGMLQRGFELGRMTQAIESHAALELGHLEVPFDHFDWFGARGRRFVGCFSDSEGLEELTEQGNVIQSVLSGVRGTGIRVYTPPDHISMLRQVGGGSELSTRARAEVEGIVAEHLGAAGIESVMLDSLVIGESYNKPHSS